MKDLEYGKLTNKQKLAYITQNRFGRLTTLIGYIKSRTKIRKRFEWPIGIMCACHHKEEAHTVCGGGCLVEDCFCSEFMMVKKEKTDVSK